MGIEASLSDIRELYGQPKTCPPLHELSAARADGFDVLVHLMAARAEVPFDVEVIFTEDIKTSAIVEFALVPPGTDGPREGAARTLAQMRMRPDTPTWGTLSWQVHLIATGLARLRLAHNGVHSPDPMIIDLMVVWGGYDWAMERSSRSVKAPKRYARTRFGAALQLRIEDLRWRRKQLESFLKLSDLTSDELQFTRELVDTMIAEQT